MSTPAVEAPVETMTDEEKRIRIAELCGWTVIDGVYPRDVGYRIGHPLNEWEEREAIPDYLNDLNAMHEAEEMLGPKLYHYPSALPNLPYEHHLKEIARSQWYRATAAQRAEAFLRTMLQASA